MSCPKRDISLTEKELRLLDMFRTEPFLPIVRRVNLETPYLLVGDEDMSEPLMWLDLKGLVDLDFSSPVENYAYSEYPENASRGSAALTARGQEALDTLDITGVQE